MYNYSLYDIAQLRWIGGLQNDHQKFILLGYL